MSLRVFFLYLFVLLNSFIVSYAAVDTTAFLPFGSGAGDSRLPIGESTGPISLWLPFPFFGKRESSIFVNTNGVLSFARAISDYIPTCGAMSDEQRMITPFWAHVGGGYIYYRQSIDPNLLNIVSREVSAAFPQIWGLELKWLFISTWSDVIHYGCCHGDCSPYSPKNTFQTILATDGTYSFTIFYYNKIQWTTGTGIGSGWGDKCGRGGYPAKVHTYCTLFYLIILYCKYSSTQGKNSAHIQYLYIN